ncbi:SDR family oxidoreductase [Phenylobacterium aquaticum]|uniref:SDR family NAD(P)-dependent oxidoreductase n=1 Tax=Phenylobacterium aquaticum TaxID=1763816 RepID=UPI0026F0A3F9|nr:SDR family NAD(P)-dependent oxidoreductase [Phenylobacterium aquaticum]
MARTALITGGAGAIATALSARFLERGFDLLLVDIDADRLEAAARAAPDRIRAHRADLTKPEDLEAVAELIGATPDLSVLVNNAGVIRPGDYADLAYDDVALHMAVNLVAPLRLTHAAAQRFRAERQGCILSIVSAAGMVALPGSAAYSASKFGLRGLLIALAQELEPAGVKVRSLFPGAVDTPMLRYEATHGGSVLNFLNPDVLTADQVAAAAMKAMDGSRIEVSLPAGDALLARLICAFPALMPTVLPHFVKQGEQGLKRFLKSRGLTAAPPL